LLSFEKHNLLLSFFKKPFNDRTGLHIGRHNFGRKSPAARAGEVFKPSTDSASPLGSTENTKFQFWVWGSLGGRHKWGCSAFLWPTLPTWS